MSAPTLTHTTVLLHEAVDALLGAQAGADGHYVDATFGRGGHSRLLLQSLSDIFTTGFGERVIREWYGSFVPHLLGRLITPEEVTPFFVAITSAINHAWGVEKQPSFWKHKLIALTMLAAAGLLLMVAGSVRYFERRRDRQPHGWQL